MPKVRALSARSVLMKVIMWVIKLPYLSAWHSIISRCLGLRQRRMHERGPIISLSLPTFHFDAAQRRTRRVTHAVTWKMGLNCCMRCLTTHSLRRLNLVINHMIRAQKGFIPSIKRQLWERAASSLLAERESESGVKNWHDVLIRLVSLAWHREREYICSPALLIKYTHAFTRRALQNDLLIGSPRDGAHMRAACAQRRSQKERTKHWLMWLQLHLVGGNRVAAQLMNISIDLSISGPFVHRNI